MLFIFLSDKDNNKILHKSMLFVVAIFAKGLSVVQIIPIHENL